MEKTYDPHRIEQNWYQTWESRGYFAPRGTGAPYCIMIPPPNVTGTLHMGHAFQDTIMDILIRYHRMRGDNTLWQPGTDHAGIATQMVVERQLNAEGKTRHDLGREAFVERVWAWKAESGGTIQNQLRRMGASVDWSRERFTMDEGLSTAVRETFVRLYREGLIYRGKRLVNWDPVLHTAVSDLEVISEEEKGHLWHMRYPLSDGSGHVTVATTRPETMLGDTAVAVHPDDTRYAHLVGRMLRLPLTDREIPVIADDYVDPEFGSGCVKITPAHDFNDYAVGRRHDLPMINILTPDARINEHGPQAYRGLDRYEARKRVVADLQAQGLLDRVEDHRLMVPRGDRTGAVVEPYLTDQWFVRTEPLARPAIQAVEEGRIRFVPDNWKNTYFEWMRRIEDWCISRQIWWGHRIPAWYDDDGNVFVARTEDEARAQARTKHGGDVPLRQDEDVLDTWFSSALWPFSTLGWPETTKELETFYPTSVLVTGFDIIFFWVARMMMQGLHFMGDVPFRAVHIHGLVRDEKGQKMSKTKGNVVDPLALIDKFGADALRFALLASTAHGRDIKFGESRVEGYRNFVTKLWNAARFAEMNGMTTDPAFDPGTAKLTVNRWIIGETAKAAASTTTAIEAYRFNDAALGLYHFVWADFCDWYIELAKPVLLGDDAGAKAETQATLGWVLERILHLIHPMAPFVSEALWANLFAARGGMLIEAAWPALEPATLVDEAASGELAWLIRVVSGIRAARNEVNVPAGAKLRLEVTGAGDTTRERLATHDDAIRRLARLESITMADTPPAKSLQMVEGEATYALPVGDVVDLDAERKRLGREIEKLHGEAGKLKAKLGNEAFLERAPEAVVEEQRERLAETEATAARLAAALARIA